MATSLGTFFSINEKVVLQCNDKTLGLLLRCWSFKLT